MPGCSHMLCAAFPRAAGAFRKMAPSVLTFSCLFNAIRFRCDIQKVMARRTSVVKALSRFDEHRRQWHDEASATLDQGAVIVEELTLRPPTCGQGESIAAGHSMQERGSLEGPFPDRATAPAVEEGWELVEVPT